MRRSGATSYGSPQVRGPQPVNIRKFVLEAARLADLVEFGSLTPAAAAFLQASVRAGLNVLVAGGRRARPLSSFSHCGRTLHDPEGCG